jgi:hypothetical protein
VKEPTPCRRCQLVPLHHICPPPAQHLPAEPFTTQVSSPSTGSCLLLPARPCTHTDLFSWATQREVSKEEAMQFARRQQGRRWEAVYETLQELGGWQGAPGGGGGGVGGGVTGSAAQAGVMHGVRLAPCVLRNDCGAAKLSHIATGACCWGSPLGNAGAYEQAAGFISSRLSHSAGA